MVDEAFEKCIYYTICIDPVFIERKRFFKSLVVI